MSFRSFVASLQAHSRLKLPLDYEVARLVRVKEDARWRKYDEPPYLRGILTTRYRASVSKRETAPNLFLQRQAG